MIKNEKGQATVELALSLIVLILILFAIIDFGRIFHAYLTLEHAGREGARIASLGGNDLEVVEQVRNSATSLNTNELGIAITPPIESRTRGTYVTVQLSYPISFSIPILEPFTKSPPTLKSKTIMRVE